VADRPGVLAELTAILRDAEVSIAGFNQPEAGADGLALVTLLTHAGPAGAVETAARAIAGLGAVAEPPLLLPILGDDE
jgi:homoserine dehydrogenase